MITERPRRTLRYPNDIDPILGYAPGRILTDDLLDYRSEQAAEAVLLLDDQAGYNDFKAIYAPLHTPGSAVVGPL